VICGVRRLEDLPREELVESLRRALDENEELKVANVELARANTELSERLAKLERLVSRNSGNSSTPEICQNPVQGRDLAF
jgi:transposase